MSSSTTNEHHGLQRINGKLHTVHQLRDEAGQLIGTFTKRLNVELHWEDIAQMVAGAFVMALPIAFTEEVWNLGESLSAARILAVFALSLVTLAMFVWSLFYVKHAAEYKNHFVGRVVSAYLVTFLVALLLLLLIDKAPLDDIGLTLSRTVIVAFPAAFAATAVDFIK